MINLAFTILKHFRPGIWFRAILNEAQTNPATVAGIFFISMCLLAGGAVYAYDRLQTEVWRTSMESIVQVNTRALACNSQERRIAAKVREVETVVRLIRVTEEDTALQQLDSQRAELERELRNLEKQFDKKCLNGVI